MPLPALTLLATAANNPNRRLTVLHILETTIIGWQKQIKNALKQQPDINTMEPNFFTKDEIQLWTSCINKLNNLISECNFYNPSNKSVVDSNRNTPDNAYASSSLLSDWSDMPKIGSKIWSPQSSNNNSYENEANRSYLSSPRPIRAIKKSQNINVINVKDELVDGKKNESMLKFCFQAFFLFISKLTIILKY